MRSRRLNGKGEYYADYKHTAFGDVPEPYGSERRTGRLRGRTGQGEHMRESYEVMTIRESVTNMVLEGARE